MARNSYRVEVGPDWLTNHSSCTRRCARQLRAPNELVPDDANVEDILAAISIAIADGLELRRHLTDEPVPFYRLKTGPNGEEEEWNLFALAAYASIKFLTNIGPEES
jgi:hypothetical protein